MMPLRVHLPNNSDMNPLELRSGIGPQADAVKDVSGLPTPIDRFPFTLFAGTRRFIPAGNSSWLRIPQTLEGLLTKIRFRTSFNIVLSDAQTAYSYPTLDIRIGAANIASSNLTLLPAPPVGGVSAGQFNFHIFDRPEGVIETNYPLTPNSIIQFLFMSRICDIENGYFAAGLEVFGGTVEMEGILWTRQSTSL